MSPDVAASVKARLLARSKETGEEFERTLSRFAAERLLYRLGASPARDRCVLKGASLLAVWLPDPYRATRDVDVLLSGQTSDEAIRALVKEVCAVECAEDGLRFDLSQLTVEAIRAEDEYAGKRVRFRALLGSARIAMQIDMGVGDALAAPPEDVTYPTMLATLPAPQLRAYPREAAVAEKFEAMVTLDVRNSRMKDFHDVWALSGAFAFDGPKLHDAVTACFERRGTTWTSETPRLLTTAFYELEHLQRYWRSYVNAGATLAPPPAAFEIVGERVIAFLAPVREAIVAGDDFARAWPAGGPWREGSAA